MLERSTAIALCAALLISGCSPPERNPRDRPQDETTPEAEPQGLRDDSGAWVIELSGQRRSEAIGATIMFPSSWSTLEDPDTQTTYFDPSPFDAADVTATEVPRMALQFRIVPKSFEETVGSLEGVEVSKRRLLVHGRDAVLAEHQSGGANELGIGTRTYAYYIELDGGRTLQALTYQLSGLDYKHNKRVLDAMIPAIDFDSSN